MVGIFLVLIGLVWLLNRLGVITAEVANLIWPIILIAIGLSLVFKRRWHWCCGPWEKNKEN